MVVQIKVLQWSSKQRFNSDRPNKGFTMVVQIKVLQWSTIIVKSLFGRSLLNLWLDDHCKTFVWTTELLHRDTLRDIFSQHTKTHTHLYLSQCFWPLCCLFFFEIGILIAPLVSSNSSSFC
jgi:hypothetical protein